MRILPFLHSFFLPFFQKLPGTKKQDETRPSNPVPIYYLSNSFKYIVFNVIHKYFVMGNDIICIRCYYLNRIFRFLERS